MKLFGLWLFFGPLESDVMWLTAAGHLAGAGTLVVWYPAASRNEATSTKQNLLLGSLQMAANFDIHANYAWLDMSCAACILSCHTCSRIAMKGHFD